MANSITRAADASTGESFWFTQGNKPDEWTSRFLGQYPDSIALNRFYPWMTGKVPASRTDGPAIRKTDLQVLTDTVQDGKRCLRISVLPVTQASEVNFYMEPGKGKVALRIGNFTEDSLAFINGSRWCRFLYIAPPAGGITLTLFTQPQCPLKMVLHEVSYEEIAELPEYTQRPPRMMNGGDRTILCSRFEF
jgi:hypothetical protein